MNRYLQIVRQKADELRRARATSVDSKAGARQTQDTFRVRGEVELGGQSFQYAVWDGHTLSDELIAVDTETARIEGNEIPRLAMVSVSTAHSHFLVHPDRTAEFIQLHHDRHFVAHNAAFDFWVLDHHLRELGQSESLDLWWAVVDQSRLHDTMLLDVLIRLGRSDEDPRRTRNLAEVCRDYAEVTIDKSDPYRLRYGEIIGLDWDQVEPGFFEYAVKDAIATHRVFLRMAPVARKLVCGHETVTVPDTVQRFGLLTEALQVQGAIALAAIERHGLQLDLEQVEALRQHVQGQIRGHIHAIQEMPEAKDVFKRDKAGELVLSLKGQVPSINNRNLAKLLQELAQGAGALLEIPRTTKTDTMTTSTKFWSQHRSLHPFIAEWTELAEWTKLNQFLTNLSSGRIHPRYTVLVRTGRTSCFKPNVQQLPRAAGFREMITASPQHYLLAVDYAAIELRTLATICEHRFGSSVLADVIRQGVDPHAYTAALFEGMDLEQFMVLKEQDPGRFKSLRQRAKALNFGIPGGLGAASLVDYAATTYGVTLTKEAAQEFRRQLIQDIYPEIGTYLCEDSLAGLAHNLGADVELVRSCFQSTTATRNVVRGHTCKEDGTPYNQTWYEGVWQSLIGLNKNPELQLLLEAKEGSEELHNRLFWGPVLTLTGRIRGRVSFSQAKNTPFQGLAADGAKRALWKLTMAGYRCVAFIHDEVLIELPVDADHGAEAQRIVQIMCEAMQEFTGDVPIACEFALMTCWSKQAEAVWDKDGRLVPWKP